MKKYDEIVVTDQDDMFYGYEGVINRKGKHLIEVQLEGVPEIQKYLATEIMLKEAVKLNEYRG
ncbi:hypothetical protein [Niallia taxi]|uniref:hypothetical protein n=1 Tax=Niallia taxi TaxID=2499688 RepID=UPI003008DBAE